MRMRVVVSNADVLRGSSRQKNVRRGGLYGRNLAPFMSNVVDKSIATSQQDMCGEYPPALCLPVHSFMQLAGREKINQLWNASVVLILRAMC